MLECTKQMRAAGCTLVINFAEYWNSNGGEDVNLRMALFLYALKNHFCVYVQLMYWFTTPTVATCSQMEQQDLEI